MSRPYFNLPKLGISGAASAWPRLVRRYGPSTWRPRRLVAALDASLQHLSHEALSRDAVRGMRFFWLDGLFSSFSANLYSSYVVLFALAYGATNAQVGQLTAIGSLLAALALFPGAQAIALVGRRKPIVVWTGAGAGRLVLLLWAVVPFLIHDATAAIWAIIILNAVSSFMTNFGVPAWTSMVADIVPLPIRGRYFSSRNLAMSVMALVAVPLAGWMIKAGNGLPGTPFGGYQLVFSLAFVTGMLSTYAFQQIGEDVDPRAAGRRGQLRVTAGLLAGTPGFMGFVASAFVWNLGLQIAGPFFNVYLVNVLGANTGTVGLLTAVSSVFALLSQAWVGRWTDRKGNLWMMAVSGLLIPLMPLAWLLVTAPWQVTFINIASGVLWTGYSLANFNLLLEIAPDEARADAAALYQFVVAGAAVVGPLAGGYLADVLGYKWVFGMSAAWRWVGALLFLWLAARPALRAGNGASA